MKRQDRKRVGKERPQAFCDDTSNSVIATKRISDSNDAGFEQGKGGQQDYFLGAG